MKRSSPRLFSYTRRASHAGSWYSDEGEELDEELGSWLEEAKAATSSTFSEHELDSSRVRAIIAPHAGYSYSGSTAAYAYAQLDPARIKRVFVLGPSHHVYLRGCAISAADKLETPLGDISVDREITEELLSSGLLEAMTCEMDEEEHSIEMHLPYIKKCMGARPFTVVTIIVGSTSKGSDEKYGALLAPYLRNAENFFIVSSDFCHWGSRFRYQPYDSARGEIHQYIHWLDHVGMALLENLDLDGFYNYLDDHSNTICGRHPLCVFVRAVKEAKESSVSSGWSLLFVKYAQSSACKNKRDSSAVLL